MFKKKLVVGPKMAANFEIHFQRWVQWVVLTVCW